jgi:hypothetical protein
MKGVATLYRWSVLSDQQPQFLGQWRRTARELRRRGALGCHLLRAENGEFVGLIRWPSDYARELAAGGSFAPDWPGVKGAAAAELSIEHEAANAVPASLGLAL